MRRDSKICESRPRRKECFEKSMRRNEATRHVWRDCPAAVDAFAKNPNAQQIYGRRTEPIERSLVEAKENHRLRTWLHCGHA